MVAYAEVELFQRNTSAITTLAQDTVTDLWSTLNPSRNNPLAVRGALETYYPDIVQVYSDSTALVAADFYDSMRRVPTSAGSFAAIMAQPANVERASAVARWAITPLFQSEPDWDKALTHLLGGTDRLVKQAGRDTVFESAMKDPAITGYARVPGGAEPCRFCLMLAGRGAVYKTDRAAGALNRYHNDCNCAPVTIRTSDDWPDGYDYRAHENVVI